MKFQDNYNMQIENMEDLILISYVMIDELYKQYAPQEVTKRKNVSKVKLSDSEIITISICGELAGIDSENSWYNFVKKNYLYLFPDLCCRSKFNRKRRDLLQVTELIREKLFQFFNVDSKDYYIVDSFPLEVCKFGRAHFAAVLGVMVPITENAHQKKKLISDLKFMPSLRLTALLLHLTLLLLPLMTERDCVI